MSAHEDLQKMLASKEVRHLDITDTERIARYRVAGYGGCVSDSMSTLGVRNTVLHFERRWQLLAPYLGAQGHARDVVDR